MILAIVPQDEAESVLKALVGAGYTTTFVHSRGGALRQAQQMLFTAVAETEMENVLTLIRSHCRTSIQAGAAHVEQRESAGGLPITARLGGAIIFVWELERFEVY